VEEVRRLKKTAKKLELEGKKKETEAIRGKRLIILRERRCK